MYMRSPLEVKIGIYRVEDLSITPSKACDLAKLACDSIKDRLDVFLCEYTAKVQRAVLIRDYVIDHLDEAFSKGYIQVYYQPVIRSISKTLCGLEALARWIDPVYGFLKPNEFIPALENTRQLYQLDLYILEEVCKRSAPAWMTAYRSSRFPSTSPAWTSSPVTSSPRWKDEPKNTGSPTTSSA